MDEPLHFDEDIRARLALVEMSHPHRALDRVGRPIDQSSESLVIRAVLSSPRYVRGAHDSKPNARFLVLQASLNDNLPSLLAHVFSHPC